MSMNNNQENTQISVPVTVLYGGCGGESAVSRKSGKAVVEALRGQCDVIAIDMPGHTLPADLLPPEETVIFPVMHGEFGEDGKLQALFEAAGYVYAGSNSTSSALCMDKIAVRRLAEGAGIRMAPALHFTADNRPHAPYVISRLGEHVVLKPFNLGSTLGVELLSGLESIKEAIDRICQGCWLIEKRIFGDDATVGILNNEALGVVRIIPKEGFLTYDNKYIEGRSTYEFPARIPAASTEALRRMSREVFHLCGCRDFARADFMLDKDFQPWFLEINSIPGMTATSFLPKSALVFGLDFPTLVRRMIQPAITRFEMVYGRQAALSAAARRS